MSNKGRNPLKDKYYHHKEWLSFWHENQREIYDDFSEWCSPEELAQIWYQDEEPDWEYQDKEFAEQTIWFSAGVFTGAIVL